EMKRLYVRAEARKAGLGRQLAEAAIAAGHRLGYRRICLDTRPSMGAAPALYQAPGVRRVGGSARAPRRILVQPAGWGQAAGGAGEGWGQFVNKKGCRYPAGAQAGLAWRAPAGAPRPAAPSMVLNQSVTCDGRATLSGAGAIRLIAVPGRQLASMAGLRTTSS